MNQPNSSTEATSTQSTAGAASSVSSADKRELVITRVLDAPRELVFKLWTDPKHVARWWGPKWFTNPVCELDARPGGAIRIDMADPDGVIYPMKGVFQEVLAPERLVFSNFALEDEQGDAQLEGVTTVTFAEHEGKTKLTLHVVMLKVTPAAQGALDGMEEGWNQSRDKLTDYVATV